MQRERIFLKNSSWFVLLILITMAPLHAQFFTYLQMETGTARFKSNDVYLVNRPSIRFGQQLKRHKFRFYWNVFYQPELFLSNASVSSQRFNGQFFLLNQFKNLSTLLHFRSRYQNFNVQSKHYAWQSSDFTLNINYYTAASFFWTASGGLWYRDTNDFDHQKLNVRFWQIGPSWLIHSVLLQVQLYHERYLLKPLSLDSLKNKKGQRIGLDLHFEQNKKYIFSLRYRLLLHFHQNHMNPSTDQEFHALVGFWLSEDWSFLLFGEFIKLGKIKSLYEPSLLYLPMNSTNRIFLKIGKDISRSTEAYLRFGHEQEQLIRKSETWQFWEFIVGIKWQRKF